MWEFANHMVQADCAYVRDLDFDRPRQGFASNFWERAATSGDVKCLRSDSVYFRNAPASAT